MIEEALDKIRNENPDLDVILNKCIGWWLISEIQKNTKKHLNFVNLFNKKLTKTNCLFSNYLYRNSKFSI